MRFDDLIRVDEQPDSPSLATRTAVATDTAVLDMASETQNAGFAEALVSKRGGFLRSNRRGFLKGGAAVAGAGAARKPFVMESRNRLENNCLRQVCARFERLVGVN